MSVEQVKALALIGSGTRALGWDDRRPRSPKELSDFSGVILGKVTSRNSIGVQPLDFDLLSRIYMCSDLAWTCINLVSSTAALGKLRVRTKDSNGETTYLPNHPLQKTLDFPNSSMTQFDLIQAYVTHQMLFGSVLMILMRRDMAKQCSVCKEDGEESCTHMLWEDTTSPVMGIMPVHPDNFEIRFVKHLQKRCFFYIPNPSNGLKYIIHENNMLTDPFYNPDVSFYGVSPTQILLKWLNLDGSMANQAEAYFENGAIPSMIVSLKPGNNYSYDSEPDTLVKKMKEGWMNQFSAKGKTPKAPAFVFGDVAVQKVQERVDETIGKMLFYEIQDRVCATYGVPPTLYEMGLRYGAQRASAEQHEKDFYNRTISKILLRLKLKLDNLVLPSYGDPNLELFWDLSDMGIASFLIEKKQKTIEKHWELGLLKRNEARVLLTYEPDQSEFGDDYYRITVMGDGTNSTENQLDNNLAAPGQLSE